MGRRIRSEVWSDDFVIQIAKENGLSIQFVILGEKK
jgi:hypothetical protein